MEIIAKGEVFAGRYRVLGSLGSGGAGLVLAAQDLETDRQVAIKMLTRDALTPEQEERFRREGEISAGLAHPGIVKVHGTGRHAGRLFLVFELVEGARTLGDVCQGLSLDERAALVRDVAAALGHAHAVGVIHRDVKPSNLLVDDAGRVRVADFGVALHDSLERLTKTGAIVGTPHYMAPEQVSGERSQYGPWTDVWALGVVLYELLCGQLPFQADTFVALSVAITDGTMRPVREVSPECSSYLAAVCVRALQVDPRDRYQDGAALAEALDRALQGRSPHGLFVPVKQRLVGSWVACGAGVVALAVCAVTFGPQTPTPTPTRSPESSPTVVPISQRTPSPVPTVEELPEDVGEPLQVFDHPGLRVAAFAGGGTRAVSVGGPAAILWDLTSGELLATHSAEPNLQEVAVTLDGSRVAFGGGAGTAVVLVNALSGTELLRRDTGEFVRALAWSHDGKGVAAGGPSGVVRVYDLKGALVRSFEHGRAVQALAFSPDGRFLAVGVGDARAGALVHLWTVDGMAIEQKHALRTSPVCIVFHPDGGSFVLGDTTGFALRIRARAWKDRDFVALADGSLPGATFTLGRAHSHRIGGVAYLPDGTRVLTASAGREVPDNDVAVWDAATGKLIGRVLRRPARCGSIDVSPDGRRVLLSDQTSSRVEVWSLAVVRVP